jgi:hypothetical protein
VLELAAVSPVYQIFNGCLDEPGSKTCADELRVSGVVVAGRRAIEGTRGARIRDAIEAGESAAGRGFGPRQCEEEMKSLENLF